MRKLSIILFFASTLAFVVAKHHKEEHHLKFIDNPEPSKEDSLAIPIVIHPVDESPKKDSKSEHNKEETIAQNSNKKIKPGELVFHKKYFDDNPLTPPPQDALIPKAICATGDMECEKHQKNEKRSGRHRRHHKHKRSRRASDKTTDDKKIEDSEDKPQSDSPDDLVPAESYAGSLDPCSLPYTPRCGGPSYDIVNPFERRFNGIYRQLPRPLTNYYLPAPPYSVSRWVPQVSPYYPITTVYWNPGFPYDNRPFRPPQRPVVPDRPGQTTPPDIENRFPGQVDDDDDRPIWDYVIPRVPSPTRKPPPPLNHAQEIEQSKKPSSGSSPANQLQQNELRPNQRPNQPQRPAGGFGQQAPPQSSSSSSSSSGFGSPSRTPIEKGASRVGACVYAIVACCNPRSDRVYLDCFERLGCPGPFWDRNPCSSELAIAALTAANQIIG